MPRARKGDNLFTNSIFAVRPKTGERVWYYQTSPNDPFDYDAVQTPVIGTINVAGQPRKVVMQANRNGFLYVLDAKDGKLLAANAFGKVNWADGVDHENRTAQDQPTSSPARSQGKNVTVWPSVSGVTNWQHMSFSPKTGLLYINTIHVGMTYEAPEPAKFVPGKPSGPGTVKRTTVVDDPNVRGFLKAVDPMTGKVKWEAPYKSPNFSSTMSTASDLVFTGVMTGEFQALDADTGKVLWSFQTPSGIVGQPVTWEKDGKQYITVIERHRRRVCVARRRSQPRQCAGGRIALDLRPVRQVASKSGDRLRAVSPTSPAPPRPPVSADFRRCVLE